MDELTDEEMQELCWSLQGELRKDPSTGNAEPELQRLNPEDLADVATHLYPLKTKPTTTETKNALATAPRH